MNNVFKFIVNKRYFIYTVIILLLILLLIKEYTSHDNLLSHEEKKKQNSTIRKIIYGLSDNNQNNNRNNNINNNRNSNRNNNSFVNAREKDLFQDSLFHEDADIKDHYNSIVHFLEDYEEPLLNKKSLNGCYDNDALLEQITEKGNTCKTYAREVNDIFKKSNELDDPHNLVDNYGNQYSFAEICPVTSNITRPIECLYNKNKNINELGLRTANVIDIVQNLHENKLDKLNSNLNYHALDNDRLYNKENTDKFLQHEIKNNMNQNVRKDILDIIDDVLNYSKNVKREFE